MSINNEEEFKVNISGKQYLINISILEDQLSLVLTIKILIFIKLFLGIGDWGLGIGDWGLGPIPNPQSPK